MVGFRFPRSVLRAFLANEAAGGIVLIVAAALAMVVANLPATAHAYHAFVHARTGPVIAPAIGPMTVHLWINDALMALFFLLVGLEIKREFMDGRLSTWERRRLPVIAAGAGMALPALVYLTVTRGTPGLHAGWAIPAATDIAFAIGVLALLGSRAPTSLKLFLTTVAIVDDMGAVAIIALAYTDQISTIALGGAALVLGLLYVLGKSGVGALPVYAIGVTVLWYCVLLSGVHATIAGVAAALVIPITPSPGAPDDAASPLHRLEHALHPWVAFAIVPLFGFANAGVDLSGMGLDTLLAPLPLGIAAGLVVGKQLGIFGAVWGTVKLGLASKPAGATWLQIYGVALLCGIGFTMSLFIGGLAFRGDVEGEVKLGVLAGSIVSACAGFVVLRFAPALQPAEPA
ncbi:sodium/proton antiporter (NhaA family) [Hephaestia caeni]|uniref:Na(+)/H(+) antiporter NhaA n=1 Tax=Hephaestia caeni TaxID=645617 RepID=A0A397P5U7_9SPHN|nr:Na+/H+ antiporter NhaA [Hephaestia caeni]RIA44552.1 sodium/proton antiporter (NhaA family) [Hephaestia caeni]